MRNIHIMRTSIYPSNMFTLTCYTTSWDYYDSYSLYIMYDSFVLIQYRNGIPPCCCTQTSVREATIDNYHAMPAIIADSRLLSVQCTAWHGDS